jgi:hypothetical protein
MYGITFFDVDHYYYSFYRISKIAEDVVVIFIAIFVVIDKLEGNKRGQSGYDRSVSLLYRGGVVGSDVSCRAFRISIYRSVLLYGFSIRVCGGHSGRAAAL